jgi:hypothetical protein
MNTSAHVVALLAVVAMAGCAGASDSAGEDGTTDEAPLLAGDKLSPETIAGYLRSVGFPEKIVPTMVCTAKWESSYYTGAKHTDSNGTSDIGLFQINDKLWADACGISRTQLLDPRINTKCALQVYHSKSGINSWNGYKAHRPECDSFTLPNGETAGQTNTAPAPQTCYSGTLQTSVYQGACVQEADQNWYQCTSGGTLKDATSVSGPAGACTDTYPLGS